MGEAKFRVLDVELSQIFQLNYCVTKDFHGWKPVAVTSIKYCYHQRGDLLLEHLEVSLPRSWSYRVVPTDVDNLPVNIIEINLNLALVV